jgi:ADP-dependent NAD(P)H-hydrate dehydratase / NAD(P)H-hydrate epimerase
MALIDKSVGKTKEDLGIPQECRRRFFAVSLTANKGELGRALLFGGSRDYPFAPAIAATFASWSGVGYVGLALPSSCLALTAARVPLSCIFPSDPFQGINRYQAILFGNGLQDNAENQANLRRLLKEYEGILIVDATGLDLLKEVGFAEKNANLTVILTPHLGEAKRLLDSPIISKEPEDYQTLGQAFTDEHDVLLLLKSYHSLLLQKGKKAIASSYPATPSLAHAGSGDALAGLLLGLLARPHQDLSVPEIILMGDEAFHLAAASREKDYPECRDEIMSLLPYLDRVF